jgi:hypothetical protein
MPFVDIGNLSQELEAFGGSSRLSLCSIITIRVIDYVYPPGLFSFVPDQAEHEVSKRLGLASFHEISVIFSLRLDSTYHWSSLELLELEI